MFRRAVRASRVALAFLTVVPVRFAQDDAITPNDVAASRFAYPVVAAVLGLILASLSGLLSWAEVPASVAAFVLLAALVTLTGGLHLDGLADTADGLFLWGDRARRLAVMREPHLGSFGVTAIVVVLLGQFATLSALGDGPRALGVLAAVVVSRTSVLIAAGLAPYARPEGTGRALVEATSIRDVLGAVVVILAVGLALDGARGVLGGLVVVGLAVGLARLARARLGGVTGDVLGALIELGELAFLLVLVTVPSSP